MPTTPSQGSSINSSDLLAYGQSQQRHGNLQQAMAIYSQLASVGGDETALLRQGFGGRALQPNHVPIPVAIRTRAREALSAIQGTGGFTSARAEHLLNQTMDGLFDLAPLGAMVGAGFTYRLARFGLLGTAARAGLSSPLVRPAASLLAFGGEATLFPIYGRLGNMALGRQVSWASQDLAHDIAGSFFILGGLKAFGFAGNRALAGWQQGTALRGGLSQRLLPTLVPQTAMYLGILAGHQGEQWAGLSPQTSTGQMMAESLVTLAHFNAMGRLIPVFAGPGVRQVERQLDFESQRMGPSFSKATEDYLDQVRVGLQQLVTGPELARAGARGLPSFAKASEGPSIMRTENQGDGPGPRRTPQLTPPETPWGLDRAPRPVPESSESTRLGIQEAREALQNCGLEEIVEELIRNRGRVELAAQRGFQVSQRDFVERLGTLRDLNPSEVNPFPIEASLLFIREHRGVESIEHLELPGRPRHLLLSNGIIQIRQLVDQMTTRQLQGIPGMGPRWEGKIMWALMEHSGIIQAGTRIREIQELIYHDELPGAREKVGKFQNRIRNTLLKDFTSESSSEVLPFTFAYNHSQNEVQMFEGDISQGRPGFFSVEAHYHQNRIRMTQETFFALDEIANNHASGSRERHFALALMGLWDQPLIVALEEVQSIRIPGPNLGEFGSAFVSLASSQPNPITPLRPLDRSTPPPPRPVDGEIATVWIPQATPVPEVETPRIPSVTRNFGKYAIEVDVEKGFQTVRRSLEQMDMEDLLRLGEISQERPGQPWFIAGISDGMGFQSTAALIASGMMRHGVGVFYEPPALLRKGSPVHLGRLANVEGLRVLAQRHGVDFAIHYEDMILPRWGHPDGARLFPADVMASIDRIRSQAESPDLNFINSIAFARWISPSPGVEQRRDVPSVDHQGRVVLMQMKPYQEKGYQGTLDSMGRNHGELLANLGRRFGPQSTSFFYTWAGGSQNWQILHGIYGGGALGHAKEIGETAAVTQHLRSQAAAWDMEDVDLAYGSHRVVRYPDFLSFALFGIPGGGGFGLIARHVLEQQGMYLGVSQLAPQTFVRAFDGTHNRRNPLAQIEFDAAETAYLRQIRANLEEFYRRVEQYREENPDWDGKALDEGTSRRLLRGLVGEDYVDQIPSPTE